MGLFENLGRKVEEFKQEAVAASEDEASRECAACGELIYADREDCPECGSDQVVARATTDGVEESGAAETSGEADASETDDIASDDAASSDGNETDDTDDTAADDETPPDSSD